MIEISASVSETQVQSNKPKAVQKKNDATTVHPKVTLRWWSSFRNAGKALWETTKPAGQLEPGGAQNKSASGQKQSFSKTI